MMRGLQGWITALVVGATTVTALTALTPGSALAASCNQESSARIVMSEGTLANGSTITIPPGTKVWPVGITVPGNPIEFDTLPVAPPPLSFQLANGAQTAKYTTGNANDNCVVNQPDDNNAPLLVGQSGYIQAKYLDWRTNLPVTTYVGHVIVT
jgi:hypothetical protein